MKILIVGAAGQLGRDLQGALPGHALLCPGHEELDVRDAAEVTAYIADNRPEAVVNTSGFSDVPKCETEPGSAFAVNATGAMNLARACAEVKARFFHVSTDYVFDGTLGRPCREDDPAAPLMVYGASKLAGEHLAVSNCDDAFMVRTTGLFGKNPCRAKPGGRNFVETMLRFGRERGEVKVVGDQQCCPTYTPDLAKQIALMTESDIKPGVYHAVTPPGASWFEFARMVFEVAGEDVKMEKVTSDFFPATFKRPADSRLENAALEAARIMVMGDLRSAVERYFGNSNE